MLHGGGLLVLGLNICRDIMRAAKRIYSGGWGCVGVAGGGRVGVGVGGGGGGGGVAVREGGGGGSEAPFGWEPFLVGTPGRVPSLPCLKSGPGLGYH